MSESVSANVNALIGELGQKDASKEEDRDAILQAAQKIVGQLENPMLKAFDFLFSFGGLPCACIAADLGIFPLLAQGGKTAEALASATSSDELLIVRIMRNLVAFDICIKTNNGEYALTPMGHFLSVPPITVGIQHCFDTGFRPIAKLPEYFRERGYKNPDNYYDGPFQYAYKIDSPWFEWLQRNEREFNNFNTFMLAYGAQKKPWVDLFPAEEVIWEGIPENDSVTVVDVGGGYGHDLMLLKSKFKKVPQRLVVQDLPKVIASAPENTKSSLETMDHDFFTPQPIKGARAYVLRNIIHDWPEKQAVEILKNLAAVMEPGYSKILLVDHVISETTYSPFIGGLDMIMMVAFASLERTEKKWEEVLIAAGLKKGRVWTMPDGDCMIEGIKT